LNTPYRTPRPETLAGVPLDQGLRRHKPGILQPYGTWTGNNWSGCRVGRRDPGNPSDDLRYANQLAGDLRPARVRPSSVLPNRTNSGCFGANCICRIFGSNGDLAARASSSFTRGRASPARSSSQHRCSSPLACGAIQRSATSRAVALRQSLSIAADLLRSAPGVLSYA
jgi:hypothetical protein